MARKKETKEPGRTPKLLQEIQVGKSRTTVRDFIIQTIEGGAWDYVAAEAAGISQKTFYRYLSDGETAQEKADAGHALGENEELYLQFRQSVIEARARARATAEVDTKRSNSLAWLKSGPGKERPGRPGWTDSHKVELSGEITQVNVDEETVRRRIDELARKKLEEQSDSDS